MPIHPLWQPFDVPDEDELDRAMVSGSQARGQVIEVVEWDPTWRAAFERVAGRIRAALGERVLFVQHIGSTAVPGLPAKPVVDVDVVVADPDREESYVPPLEELGLVLVVREPGWQQHRMFRSTDPVANVHVFGPDAVEPRRHRLFRDHLRRSSADRAEYGRLKRALAGRSFPTVGAYNAAKAPLIYDLYERAFAADPTHGHTPQPRASHA